MASCIIDFLSPRAVMLDVRVPTKLALLRTLSERASAATGLPAETIFAELNKRESLGSTGMGDGIALPHAAYADLKQTFGLVARLKPPVEFEAIDSKPVDLAFLLLTPAGAEKTHLNALAAVSRRLRNRDVAEKLRMVNNENAFYDVLRGSA
ncbi:MAG TPA: PTS sugar transporter subunit IIA [Hyphomicrobium sp.]|nr:PTS sugar transporter subunit IIA [Hyphomicrobium sp.]